MTPTASTTRSSARSNTTPETTVPLASEAVLPPSWDDLLDSIAIVDSAHATPNAPAGRVDTVPQPEPDDVPEAVPPQAAVTESGQPKFESAQPEIEGTTEFETTSTPAVDHTPKPEIQSFRAAWEVDALEIPHSVADLFFKSQLLEDLGERMADAVAGGLGNLLVTSVTEGEGRSTVATGMALAAASRGLKVALVDCDVDRPDLMDQLRLDIDHGWADFTRRGIPLAEVAVHAVEDNITFFPLLLGDDRATVDASEAIQLIECISESFDLIVLDGPAEPSRVLGRLVATIDSAIIVRDVKRTNTDRLNAFSYRLKEAGVRGVGAVENFTSDAA